jgi:hypothetical protein
MYTRKANPTKTLPFRSGVTCIFSLAYWKASGRRYETVWPLLQAKHTLEYILKMQIQEKREALGRIQQQTSSIQIKLHKAAQQLLAAGGDSAESAPPQMDGVPDGPAAMDTN